MSARAVRGMSAPPEVVFSTATDPDRASAWLPEPLRGDGSPAAEIDGDELRARWGDTDDWSAEIRVEPADSGGARIELDLTDGSGGPGPDQLADQALTNLAREVADNLQAG
ncbi:SRPBCC family protein [Micromonospora sp. DH14]|uniref:SRPBCC family protein n=1 Tax=Micromonospora sp. DH14 TaxID=3040120 RepID=UPI0024433DFB|nr:SRPBCC family protein [Micromonospora sp. DH14]MDG9677729.1 SRPBCC family protein [Micromonospora sp. DH14]